MDDDFVGPRLYEGWYSAQQAAVTRELYARRGIYYKSGSVYSTLDGGERHVTEIMHPTERSNWPDAYRLGPVVRWLRDAP